MAAIDGGNSSAGVANVDTDYNLRANLPGYDKDGVARGGGDVNAGAITQFAEVDNGAKTGVRRTLSFDADQDNRARVATDNLLDQENFNYTTQNTGKHSHAFTTLTATCSAAGLLTNSGAITTTATGMTFGTFAMFPVGGTQTTVVETSVAFTAQPNANTVIDFGLFQRGASTAFLGLDGAYFRMSSAGLQGVVNNSGVETTTSVFPLSGGTGTWAYTNNNVNKYRLQITNVSTMFWINDVLYGEILNPASAGFPCKSVALPWSVRHAIVGGAAGAACSALISDYRVMIRGPVYADTLGTTGNRVFGSYQSLSGQASPASLASYANSANPSAAVPTNTTAALGTGLGGQFWQTFTLALTTDGIICSYLVPAGSATVAGRRLKIRGVSLASYVQTVLAGGPCVTQYSLAFGHTALSLATAESASFATGTAKAPRRIALPPLTQAVTAAQAVSTLISQPGGGTFQFEAPVYVNPGEYVALVAKHVGTVGTSGTIAHVVGYDYSWE